MVKYQHQSLQIKTGKEDQILTLPVSILCKILGRKISHNQTEMNPDSREQWQRDKAIHIVKISRKLGIEI